MWRRLLVALVALVVLTACTDDAPDAERPPGTIAPDETSPPTPTTRPVEPAATVPAASVDGRADCEGERWEETSTYGEDSVGRDATAADALERALGPPGGARRAEIVILGARGGSRVVDGREVLVVHVTELPAGGFAVSSRSGCVS